MAVAEETSKSSEAFPMKGGDGPNSYAKTPYISMYFSPGEAVTVAQEVVNTMAAKGYDLGQYALIKAKKLMMSPTKYQLLQQPRGELSSRHLHRSEQAPYAQNVVEIEKKSFPITKFVFQYIFCISHMSLLYFRILNIAQMYDLHFFKA